MAFMAKVVTLKPVYHLEKLLVELTRWAAFNVC